MTQRDFERLSELMADKGVRHEAFELLADLRTSEKRFYNMYTAASMQLHMVKDSLSPFCDFEGFHCSDVNFIQVLRKLIEDKKNLQWLEAENEKLREALRDCVNVMEGQVMQLGDRKEHHVLYDEWKAGKELLEEE